MYSHIPKFMEAENLPESSSDLDPVDFSLWELCSKNCIDLDPVDFSFWELCSKNCIDKRSDQDWPTLCVMYMSHYNDLLCSGLCLVLVCFVNTP